MTTGDVLLAGRDLVMRFGGLAAVDGVTVELRRGEVHAVIGTNGAGKSTLVHMLSGELVATSGRVLLGDDDITAWPQPKRARAGIGRSYQRTNVFAELTVFENARLSAQAAHARPFAVWESARRCAASSGIAERALAAAGLSAEADRPAAALSHGGKRQLEIAMCLATEPTVLLLDEPLAGMGAEETDRMLSLLAALKATHAILLVEHDMDAVFRVADRITVMVNGAVIASGDPAAIRVDPQVRVAYLGEDD
jgi:branched-chain amino acid transport system ATP-binding protein